jgi:hypothetical protein
MAFATAYARRRDVGDHEELDRRFIVVNFPDWNPPVVDGRFSDKILAEIDRDELRLVVSTFGGNDHNALGLVNYPGRSFDFVLPEAPDLPLEPNAEVLPVSLIEATLRRRLRPALRLMRLLRQETALPIIHLESPPPIPSEEYIRNHPYGFEDLIAEHGVAPATLRYKLWRLHSSIVRDARDELRIRFVPAPRAMQDLDGMLVPDAWSGDPSHANEVYGERLFRQTLAVVARRFSETSEKAELNSSSGERILV